MADASYLVQEADGLSRFTLEDGSGSILLEGAVGAIVGAGSRSTGAKKRKFLLPDGRVVKVRSQAEAEQLIARTVAAAVPPAVAQTVLRPRFDRKGRETGPAVEPIPQLSAEVLEAIARLQQRTEMFALADAIAIAQATSANELRATDDDALMAIMMMTALA